MMKATRKTIPGLIAKREPFSNTSGTLRAVKGDAAESAAKFALGNSGLNHDEKARLRIDTEQNGIAYLIMSYDTPIAWETKNGWVHKVDQTFTQTTSKHQGMLYEFRNGKS